jgi:hypothetical protein
VRRYQLYLLKQKKLTAGTVKIRMSALRFFYRKALKRRHRSSQADHLEHSSSLAGKGNRMVPAVQ